MDRRLFRTLASSAALAFVISACGSSSQEAETTTTAIPVGGSLVQGLVKVASTDPALASTVSERVLADQLHDGLSVWNPESLQPEPLLASAWATTESNTKWTFYIRDNAKAANGDVITGTDVKRTLERIAKAGPTSPSADLVSSIVGYPEFVANATAGLMGIAVIGQTVRIDTVQPFPELPSLLANPMFGILHFAADGSTQTTGPFKVKTASETALVLERAPDSDAFIDSIDTRFFPDVDASYAAFDRGDLDWSLVPGAKSEEAAQKHGSAGFRESLRTTYLSFNLANPKVADVRFRQAIMRAIDRPAVVEALTTDAAVLDGIVPKAVPDAKDANCNTPCSHDPAEAKRLLTSVFPDGNIAPIDVALSDGAPFNEAARAQIESNLKAVGIPGTVRLLPAATYGEVTVDPAREVFQTSWTAAFPSYAAFLNPLFLSNSNSNVVQFRDAPIDAALVENEKLIDVARRGVTYRSVESALLNQAAMVPLATFPIDTVSKTSVRGVRVLPTGNFDATGVWLSR